VEAVVELERGRESYARQAWMDAYDSLSDADRMSPLRAEDRELLATAAYMIGREDDYFDSLGAAYADHLDASAARAALRCAFWIGINLALRGDTGAASGWLGRAQRLLDLADGDGVEHGYLLLPTVFEQEAGGDLDAAARTAGAAAAIGDRCGDPDLFALAAHEQGHILIRSGRLKEGLALLDEAMLTITAGRVSPIVSGIVYCGVILACQDAHDVRRAQEWTAALTRWCERQSGLVAFSGRCLVHRAEILQLHGAWPEALDEARRAAERCAEAQNRAAVADARYREGEIQRLLGALDAAEHAYREASRHGREPQPGLALLRLAQGNADAAAAAIRRVSAETIEPGKRGALLPAYVEIMLAVGDLAAAREGCRELEQVAQGSALTAMAAHARGAVDLAAGDAQAALASLRRAGQAWEDLDATYEAARVRELVGLACRALGDEDTAALELDAAQRTFAALGATRDRARVAGLAGQEETHGLTGREREVLRHLAAGATNKEIAAELVLSVRTVDRHVSNIFAKLRVSSRAAATAYAHEHRLV
jgi:DNA-binding NarL/FixJ family response regulator